MLELRRHPYNQRVSNLSIENIFKHTELEIEIETDKFRCSLKERSFIAILNEHV